MYRLIAISMVFLLQACSQPEETVKEEKPLLVQLSAVQAYNANESYEFPATVSAVKSVDLKFEVSGRLVFANLVEGSEVKKGQVLAQIDPAPFERKVAETKTLHEDAQRALKRIQEMFSRNVASQRELDDAKSQFTITKIALENAEQDLSYCTVKAPFDAVVGARFIENNSFIRAGDSVANLQDRSELHFSFEVPERIMTQNAGNRNVKATAYIIGQEDKVFGIHYVEHKTTPDPVTQTYTLTFAIDGEVTNLFYPGSRATVKIESQDAEERALIVPLRALVGEKASGFFVWRFNSDASQVEKVAVSVSGLNDNFAVISEGLTEGDKVVSAAVNQMRTGISVKEYKADF